MLKTSIITGGSKGIGKKIITDLLNKNHKVINLSRTDLSISNKKLININLDLQNKMKIKETMSDITQKYKIDNFIHCAGITQDIFFHKMKDDDWENVIQTNYLSTYYLLNPLINQMRNQKSGNIVFISSVNARSGAIGQTNYSSSKSALFGLTKSLALENASKNIYVNCICPGYIKTDMTKKINPDILNKITNNIPVKRLGQDKDISNLISYLIHNNSYMTGSIIDINGGLY